MTILYSVFKMSNSLVVFLNIFFMVRQHICTWLSFLWCKLAIFFINCVCLCYYNWLSSLSLSLKWSIFVLRNCIVLYYALSDYIWSVLLLFRIVTFSNYAYLYVWHSFSSLLFWTRSYYLCIVAVEFGSSIYWIDQFNSLHVHVVWIHSVHTVCSHFSLYTLNTVHVDNHSKWQMYGVDLAMYPMTQPLHAVSCAWAPHQTVYFGVVHHCSHMHA